MLYLAVDGDDGTQRAGIFVRNSGTEEKTGVNVRGHGRGRRRAASRSARQALLYLARPHEGSRRIAMAQRGEARSSRQLAGGPRDADRPCPSRATCTKERLLLELEPTRRRSFAAVDGGYERTERGATAMLESWK